MSLKSKMQDLARSGGGSFKTVANRIAMTSRFCDHLKSKNIQIRDPSHIAVKHIVGFVAARKEAGIGVRTLQNELSAIRACMASAGRAQLVSMISNAQLGVTGGCRAGTKKAMDDGRLAEFRKAVAATDPGLAAVLDLQRALGLRAEEGVMACRSLATWARQLDAGQPLRVIYGTKGGRPRDVRPANVERARQAVQGALAIAATTKRGMLVDQPNGKAAMARYRNVMYRVGMRGAESGHSLRYAFARDQVAAYQAEGYSKAEALAQTSMDLGHGDGRGRYVDRVYLR